MSTTKTTDNKQRNKKRQRNLTVHLYIIYFPGDYLKCDYLTFKFLTKYRILSLEVLQQFSLICLSCKTRIKR